MPVTWLGSIWKRQKTPFNNDLTVYKIKSKVALSSTSLVTMWWKNVNNTIKSSLNFLFLSAALLQTVLKILKSSLLIVLRSFCPFDNFTELCVYNQEGPTQGSLWHILSTTIEKSYKVIQHDITQSQLCSKQEEIQKGVHRTE